MEIKRWATEITLPTKTLTNSHKPLRRSLRPLWSRSLSSPNSILCNSFLSCSSLSRESWELVFLFCSMFSMFFPISSKSLSSAELLSVSVDSTSVDSSTLVREQQRSWFCTWSHWSFKNTETQTRLSLVLQVKYSLAFFFVALLVFRNGETRTPGKFTHGALAWTCLLRGHSSYHVDHLPTWKLFDLVHKQSI